jgi:hypothetical protein
MPPRKSNPAKASTAQAHRTRGVAKPPSKGNQRRLDFEKPGGSPKPPSAFNDLAASSAGDDREQAAAMPAVVEPPAPEEALPELSAAEQKELCKFDLTFKYGPCVGLSRAERWMRAQELGLEPPAHVFELLDRVAVDSKMAQSMLSGYSL